MGIRVNTIDFENIQNRIDAARSLQGAGENKSAEEVLKKLAKEIIDEN